jgi:hypothetical protein
MRCSQSKCYPSVGAGRERNDEIMMSAKQMRIQPQPLVIQRVSISPIAYRPGISSVYSSGYMCRCTGRATYGLHPAINNWI